MKSYEAMSKCLGIKLSAEAVEEFIKDLSHHAGEADLLLYEGYKLAKSLAPITTESSVERAAFLKKCEALGICDGEDTLEDNQEKKD